MSSPGIAADVQIETPRRFSQSSLWTIQRRFFEEEGISAWSSGTVPHYITSNPYIAGAYARMIQAYLRDVASTLQDDEPVYIIELAAGCGRFSYYCVRALIELLRGNDLQRPRNFVYVMTDLAEANVEFWDEHEKLRPLVEQGLLDFARFDVESDRELNLRKSGTNLSFDRPVVNPVVVIANYCFDSLRQDVFAVKDGAVHEGLVSLWAENDSIRPEEAKAEALQLIELKYDYKKLTDEDYYGDPELDAILASYAGRLGDTIVGFPESTLRFLRELRRWSGERLLLLTGDKGFANEEDLLDRREPEIVVHGSFSMMVNYHAIGEYLRRHGGDLWNPPQQCASLNVCAGLLGGGEFPESRRVFEEEFVRRNPDDYYYMRKNFAPVPILPQDATNPEMVPEPRPDLLAILAYLRYGGWDADGFLSVFEALREAVKVADARQRREVWFVLRNVWEHYYAIGEERDLAFHIGIILHEMEFFPEAVQFFERSRQRHGADPNTVYDIAVCYYHLRDLDSALRYVQETLVIDPNFEAARSLRIRLERERES